MADRDANGKFVKGNTAGGRTAMPPELKQAFQDAAPEALAVLLEIMRNPKAKHRDRQICANSILDRGFGKPAATPSDGELTLPTDAIEIRFVDKEDNAD